MVVRPTMADPAMIRFWRVDAATIARSVVNRVGGVCGECCV